MDKLNNVEQVSFLESNPTDLIGVSGGVALSGAVEMPARELAGEDTQVHCNWTYLGPVVGNVFGGVPVTEEVYYL